jgi:hypothetical protein
MLTDCFIHLLFFILMMKKRISEQNNKFIEILVNCFCFDEVIKAPNTILIDNVPGISLD